MISPGIHHGTGHGTGIELFPFQTEDSHGHGGLRHTAQIQAGLLYPQRQNVEVGQNRFLTFLCQRFFRHLSLLLRQEDHIRISGTVFRTYRLRDLRHRLFERLLFSLLHNQFTHNLVHNRIGHFTAGQGDNPERRFPAGFHQNPCGQIRRMGPLHMDITAGMTAQKSLHFIMIAGSADRFPGRRNMRIEIHCAGTAYGQNAFLFRIQIQDLLRLQLGSIQSFRTQHADLLIHGEHTFQRRMRNVLSVQHRQHHGHCDAVVRTQGSILRPDQISVHIELQRVLREIMIRILRLRRNHVDMTLQHDRIRILIAFRAIGIDDDIVEIILIVRKTVFLREIHNVIADFLRVTGAPRNITDLLEIPEHFLRCLHAHFTHDFSSCN